MKDTLSESSFIYTEVNLLYFAQDFPVTRILSSRFTYLQTLFPIIPL